MQESWSFHAAQNKHAKSFFPLAKHVPSCFQSLERSLQIENSGILPRAEFCAGQSKAIRDCSLELLPQQAGEAQALGE